MSEVFSTDLVQDSIQLDTMSWHWEMLLTSQQARQSKWVIWHKEPKTQLLLAQALGSTGLSEISVSERQSVPVKDAKGKETDR